mmetsp:Transcript_10617/g.13853  ORF Transcript_10617/g.13853 Transcript_10617/m.13853 type:complete len:103 (-) Transcript_10617:1455-1763(-)
MLLLNINCKNNCPGNREVNRLSVELYARFSTAITDNEELINYFTTCDIGILCFQSVVSKKYSGFNLKMLLWTRAAFFGKGVPCVLFSDLNLLLIQQNYYVSE